MQPTNNRPPLETSNEASAIANPEEALVNELEEIKRNAIRVLTLRAACYAAKQQYRDELRDGWMLINIASEDPAGYLCVGRRYASQGRHQRALDVFRKGLESVPMSHSDYHCLLQGKMHAQQSL
ncbi:hypothetical protein INT45_001379 [Circinella minor]|uniref:Tetratricopeptide repeat protein n=1 Tax=Circinella minor TaxID=1195481 RepID=A0A8H7RSH9_9FUNG|nr:hypothetical protein INT45_001379 [Circinella minor]